MGNQLELLEVLEGVRQLQQHCGQVTPLLVDEKVHYSILKMLYSKGWQRWDLRGWLGQVPLLYGLWHAYKQVVHLVYRTFFPIISLLEMASDATAGEEFWCARKLRRLEVLFATLLVCTPGVQGQLDAELAAAREAEGEASTASECSGSTPPCRNSDRFGEHKLSMLEGLESLLAIWIPALVTLGYWVRECYWQGGPGGQRKGIHAKRVLQHALAMLASLRGDWDCKEEYTRTVAVSLLCWQPWMDSIPACCWVEEACEAMLSRAKQTLHNHRYLDLYVTLPSLAGRTRHLRGGVKAELVPLLTARPRHLILSELRQDDLYATYSATGRTHWVVGQPVCAFPGRIDWDVAKGDQLLQSALVSLMNLVRPQPAVRIWLNGHVPLATDTPAQPWDVVQDWARARSQRGRVGRPVGVRRRRRSPSSSSTSTSTSTSDDGESAGAGDRSSEDSGSDVDLDAPYI